MTDQELDRFATAVLDPEGPSSAERAEMWADVSRRLDPPPRRRRWLAVPAIAVAAAAAFALIPPGTATRGPLEQASAAEVLHAAADSVGLDAPGPGEELYVRERRVIPQGPTEVTESWSATDGSGRLRRYGTTETFRAGAPRSGDPFGDWRGAFTADELRSLPTEQEALLDRLRATVEATAEADDLGVLGRDLGVIAVTIQLLDRAPIDAERRAALFDLLASAPEWTVPGTSLTPLSVTREGTTADGAVAIRVESRLTDAERRAISSGERGWALDLIIDPAAGRVTGLREYENGLGAPPEVTTIEAQRIVPARQRSELE